MIRSVDPYSEAFLSDLARIQARLDRAQREISTGLRVQSASDAPDAIGGLLATRARLEQTIQVRMNLGRVKAEVDTAEQALGAAVTALQRAVQLGVQGATGTQTPEMRRTIAAEVLALQEQLVSIASTRVEGRYIFSGDTDWAAPYTLDLSQPDGVSAYAGSASTRQIAHPAGSQFAIARSAQEIFGNSDPASNAFGALNDLRMALENGPTAPEGDPAYQGQYTAQTDAIDAAITRLRGVQNHVNVELSFYGTTQTKVTEAINYARKDEIRHQNQLSAIRDADVAASILAFSQARVHQEAALSARAMYPRTSLFEFVR